MVARSYIRRDVVFIKLAKLSPEPAYGIGGESFVFPQVSRDKYYVHRALDGKVYSFFKSLPDVLKASLLSLNIREQGCGDCAIEVHIRDLQGF